MIMGSGSESGGSRDARKQLHTTFLPTFLPPTLPLGSPAIRPDFDMLLPCSLERLNELAERLRLSFGRRKACLPPSRWHPESLPDLSQDLLSRPASINTLPPELLQIIFETIIAVEDFSGSIYRHLWDTSRVCKRWRDEIQMVLRFPAQVKKHQKTLAEYLKGPAPSE